MKELKAKTADKKAKEAAETVSKSAAEEAEAVLEEVVLSDMKLMDEEPAVTEKVKENADASVPEPDDGSEETAVAETGHGEEKTKVAEVKEETTEPAYVPGKKRIKKRWFVLLAVAAGVIVFLVVRSIQKKNVLPTVPVMEVKNGSIEETVTISGNVASAEKKAYYATVSAPIDSLKFKSGDRVDKGDVLFTYDSEQLELARKQAELNLEQANNSFKGSMEKNAKATNILRGNSIGDINNRLEEITAEIDAINNKITEKTDRMSGTVKELQQTLMDLNQNSIYDGTLDDIDFYERRDDEGNQMYLEVQKSLSDKQFALQHDEEIEKWNREITALNEEKARLTEQKTAETSRLTAGEKASMEAQLELTELTNNDTIESIDEVQGGIKAEFGGVVTEVGIEEGATVAKGTKVLTIQSTDDVEIALQITKTDMTKVREGQNVEITVNGNHYDGEVTFISGVATKNASGVPVVDAKIKIKNPDDSIILGVEASNKIHTNHADDVVVIPYEYVGADEEGDYVFVLENNQAVRRSVTTGLTTSTDAEITEGLRPGDLLITGNTDDLTDGMPVMMDTGDLG